MKSYDSSTLLSLTIQSAWEDIAGEDILKIAEFFEAKYNHDKTLTVVLKVISSAIFIIKQQADRISKSISDVTGVDSVDLKFRHVISIKNGIDHAA